MNELRFTYYYQKVLYDNTNILVNDMKDIIEALKLFINDIVLTPKEEIVYKINSIDIYLNENDVVYINDSNQIYDRDIKKLDIMNVEEYFKKYKDTYFEKLKELKINIPTELYGKIFICFIISLEYFIRLDNIDDTNIYDLVTISSKYIKEVK